MVETIKDCLGQNTLNTSIPPLYTKNKVITDINEKVHVFNEFFIEVTYIDLSIVRELNFDETGLDEDNLCNIHVSEEDVADQLKI